MKKDLCLRLRPDAILQSEGDDLVVACSDRRRLRQRRPTEAQRMLLECLADQGGVADDLLAQVLARYPSVDTGQLYYLLYSLEGRGFLCYSLLQQDQQTLITLEPVSARFRYTRLKLPEAQDSAASVRYRLSRFAWSRRQEDVTLLECSLAHARMVIHDARIAGLIACLAQPCSIHELLGFSPQFTETEISTLLELLSVMQAVEVCDHTGLISEDRDPVLRQWDYHDLLFHSRSRTGRHAEPTTLYRFLNEIPHEPVLKPAADNARIELPQPGVLPATDFFTVVEQRHSIRTRGAKPLTVSQLADFLWHVARIKAHYEPDDDDESLPYEVTHRPCANGGAMHELELYLTVNRCEGLESAMYRYVPDTHQLEWVAAIGPLQEKLVEQALFSVGAEEVPDILISLGARFNRMGWKYQNFAYAVILKNVGAMYQQMYLVATALSLAPCGVGVGDADLLAECINSNYYAESSVGEFMLSGRN